MIINNIFIDELTTLILMQLQLIDIKNLPKTSLIDGTALYTNPIFFIRNLFLRRIELGVQLLENREGNVLEVGVGSGIMLPTFSQIKGMIVGIDNHKYLGKVKKYLKKNKYLNIHLVQADAHKLPFKKSVFRSVVMISLLDHLSRPRLAINELYRIINFDGIIIFGFHIDNFIYNFVNIIWVIIYIASSLLIYRNFRELLVNFFKPNTWRHLYHDSILIKWIQDKFKIEKKVYLRAIFPIFIAVKGRKNKN